jgi:methylenetetrahydrofolate dehydrogenase (NADP+)/methenyltetrahydrofolate cyclohydrolase
MIIHGKEIAEQIQVEIKSVVAGLKRKPGLAVILVGENPASQMYVSKKIEACNQVGMVSKKIELAASSTESEILKKIAELNADPAIDGILVQLPLPTHVNPQHIIMAVSPEKDVDGFHPFNIGKLLIGHTDGFVSCTPLGIQELLARSGIEMTGKHAVVVGRSNIVGKPMAALLMQNSPQGNATVTVAHSQTQNLQQLCLMADVLIAAVGKPLFITADMVKDGAVVIDVGIHRIDDKSSPKGYKIVGDVDFDHVKQKTSFITPVPGGVGPMTIAMLLHNTLLSYNRRRK